MVCVVNNDVESAQDAGDNDDNDDNMLKWTGGEWVVTSTWVSRWTCVWSVERMMVSKICWAKKQSLGNCQSSLILDHNTDRRAETWDQPLCSQKYFRSRENISDYITMGTFLAMLSGDCQWWDLIWQTLSANIDTVSSLSSRHAHLPVTKQFLLVLAMFALVDNNWRWQ